MDVLAIIAYKAVHWAVIVEVFEPDWHVLDLEVLVLDLKWSPAFALSSMRSVVLRWEAWCLVSVVSQFS